MSSPLGALAQDEFLQQYWQQKPLVIRNAFPGFQSPLSPNELAGLACEEDVTAKIVIEKGGEHPWQVIHGPLEEDVFSRLPDTHWTLLVNDVEKQVPELSAVVDRFRFIPEWRFDDVMISYAPEGGSVGPHLDQYDVFILQAQGHRRWQIHNRDVDPGNQVADTTLRIQRDFQAQQEWVLAPGDMIYIPPGVSHYGVALDDCMSFSIGYRAPTLAEMLVDYVEYLSKDFPSALTYKDQALEVQENPNQITCAALANIRAIIDAHLQISPQQLHTWFGRFVSDTQTDLMLEPDSLCADSEDLLASYGVLYRHPASRFAFITEAEAASLFVDGEDYAVSVLFAQMLCREREVNLEQIYAVASKNERDLLLLFFNNGKLFAHM